MNRTGLLYDSRYLLHDTGPYHPEVSARLKAIYKGIKDANLLPLLTLINASIPEIKWVEAVHDKDYINRFKDACLSGKKIFDSPDNQMCTKTYETSLLAVGGILDTINHTADRLTGSDRP